MKRPLFALSTTAARAWPWPLAIATWFTGTALLTAQPAPPAPTDWPPSIDPNAVVDYGIFDPNAAFNTPVGWNNSMSQSGGGDQPFQDLTLAGMTGHQQAGTYVNLADLNFYNWSNAPVLDILLQVYGNGALNHVDGTPIATSWLEGTVPGNIHNENAAPTPPGFQNGQWNWLLLEITNPVSSATGHRYVGYVPSNAAAGSGVGGVNNGTLRLQNVSGLVVRAVAIGPQGAFGTTNQVNVFALPASCPVEPNVNLAYVDLHAGITNHLVIPNNGDQTVQYRAGVGPASDQRTAVQALGTYMNFGILSNYLGAPCNFPRAMKVCVEVYDDPALSGVSFGPEQYATDANGDTAVYSGPMYTLQGSDQWLRVAFVVPNVDLVGIGTTPLTGGPRLMFSGGSPFIDRAELGIYRTGTNLLANQDPDPTFHLDPTVCTDLYGNYAELDPQNGLENGLTWGSSGGDQNMVVETYGPADDLRLSERPDAGHNNLQFSIINQVFGPSYQDNARVAQVLTYYDDPAMAGASFYPQVYSSWVNGQNTYLFPNQALVAVTLQGTGQWRDAYFEIPDANFNGVNQGPQSLVRYETTPAVAGDPTTGYIHISRVRYAIIRNCGPYARVNLLQTNKPIAEYGDTVAGYQDSFSGATLSTNWMAVGPGGNNYLQTNGVLKVFASHGDPNHLVLAVPGYSNDVQEVLARLRIVACQSGDAYRGGIGVGIGTNASGGPSFQGLNLLFRDYASEAPLRHFKLLDDLRAWGPTTLTNAWTNNTWYWLRLRQEKKMDGTNSVFAKVWPADWATPEPADWQLLWPDTLMKTPLHAGFAGLAASSNDGLAQYEVSYILIKAAGLPNVQVAAAATPPAPQPPFILSPPANTFFIPGGDGTPMAGTSVSWFGPGSLVAAPSLAGPWTPVVSTTNTYATPKANLKPSEFYRLLYSQ